MGALKIYPANHKRTCAATAPPSHQAKEVQLDDVREEAFKLLASFVSGIMESAKAEALDSEYMNGALAAFHYLHSTAGGREAMELLERRRKDR